MGPCIGENTLWRMTLLSHQYVLRTSFQCFVVSSFWAFGFRKGMGHSGISFMGKADVAFDAIPLPCPQFMLLKPTQFPLWNVLILGLELCCLANKFFSKNLIAIVGSLSRVENQNFHHSVSLVLKSHRIASVDKSLRPVLNKSTSKTPGTAIIVPCFWTLTSRNGEQGGGCGSRGGCVWGGSGSKKGEEWSETEEGETVCLPSRVHLPLGEPDAAAGHLWTRAVHLMSVFIWASLSWLLPYCID